MEDTMIIVQSVEDLFIKSVAKTIENETKNQRGE